MSMQEAALYGDLVLALRDHAADQLVSLAPDLDVETASARLDEFIRAWFFTPQPQLYGSAPREIIWREQLGEGNPIPREYAAEAYGDCDCPICAVMRAEIENAADAAAHGHCWVYCPDTCLLERYDPVGSEERWQRELAGMEAWEEALEAGQAAAQDDAPVYSPAPLPEIKAVDAATFLSVLQRPWLDPKLHRAAQQLVERCDIPLTSANGGLPYRRVTLAEALSLIAGLSSQGVDAEAMLAQIDAWPYQNVALDWLTEPERNLAIVDWAMSEGATGDGDGARYRHHRDFILALAQLMPPAARLWMSGWLEAVRYAEAAGGRAAVPA